MTTNPSSIRHLRPSSADGDEIFANHRQLAERDARMKRFGYDFAAGVQFVLAHALPLPGSVLEIGTGKGRFMVAMAPHVKKMTTVDISAEEQRCARLNACYARVKTKIKYVIQDAACLPWPDRTFDVAVTMNAMHHTKGLPPLPATTTIKP